METARDRLQNLLIILLEAISTRNEGGSLDRGRFREMMVSAGYDEADIKGIMDWLETRWLPGSLVTREETVWNGPSAGGGVRYFADNEREFLDPKAFGYLLSLCQSGQISRRQMESLIHYASLVSDFPLGKSDINSLLDQVFFCFPGDDPENLPVNQRGSLH